MNLCFLHGLDSSPQGTKASLLRAYDPSCLIPNLPPDINERLKILATYEVAWTGFDEHERGSLEQGKTADMVVLNQNPLKMDPKNLLELKVNQLYLSGKTYKPKMSIFNMILNGIFESKRNI